MKKIVYVIFFVTSALLLNIWLYYFSDGYSFFLKNIKYWDEIISNDSKEITDEYKPILEENNKTQNECNCDCSQYINQLEKQVTFQKNSSKYIGKVLSKFSEFYTLNEKKYDEYYQIFDITDEYPTNYTTYSWDGLEIYFFTWAKFDDVYNMFDVLTSDQTIEKKFSLNKTWDFKKNSFFINLSVPDDFVRLVVDNWNILFWLKMKKSYYSDIKEILKNL